MEELHKMFPLGEPLPCLASCGDQFDVDVATPTSSRGTTSTPLTWGAYQSQSSGRAPPTRDIADATFKGRDRVRTDAASNTTFDPADSGASVIYASLDRHSWNSCTSSSDPAQAGPLKDVSCTRIAEIAVKNRSRKLFIQEKMLSHNTIRPDFKDFLQLSQSDSVSVFSIFFM
jgi:hypothetical protein